MEASASPNQTIESYSKAAQTRTVSPSSTTFTTTAFIGWVSLRINQTVLKINFFHVETTKKTPQLEAWRWWVKKKTFFLKMWQQMFDLKLFFFRSLSSRQTMGLWGEWRKMTLFVNSLSFSWCRYFFPSQALLKYVRYTNPNLRI